MQLRHLGSVLDISANDWNQLTGTDYPFLRHEFFAALETSGSTTAKTGWQPHHLIAEAEGRLIALLPLFVKTHSYGEYVFDWSWADAYQQHGYAYYPKLLSAIPFTPATGPRLCFSSTLTEAQQANYTQRITQYLPECAQQLGASSWHCLFPSQPVSKQLNELGMMQRLGCQFHWFNDQFNDVDQFLATFMSRKRKTVNRERRRVVEQGITLRAIEGSELSPYDWEEFYQFYHLTYFKRSGRQGYLHPAFFPTLGRTMPENLVMIVADYQGQRVAAALYFKSSTHLYGRYWGCNQEFDALHFEACYYRGIEYAIANGLQCFDPGAQGEHKIQRGFTPIFTYSNHWLADSEFSHAVADFLRREAPHIRTYQQDACSLLPFKQQIN